MSIQISAALPLLDSFSHYHGKAEINLCIGSPLDLLFIYLFSAHLQISSDLAAKPCPWILMQCLLQVPRCLCLWIAIPKQIWHDILIRFSLHLVATDVWWSHLTHILVKNAYAKNYHRFRNERTWGVFYTILALSFYLCLTTLYCETNCSYLSFLVFYVSQDVHSSFMRLMDAQELITTAFPNMQCGLRTALSRLFLNTPRRTLFSA